MNKFYQLPLQIFNYAIFMALVWYLSIMPEYHQLDKNEALITFTLGHVGKHVEDCRKMSYEELQKLPPNMRKPMSCSRERSTIAMEMKLDDKVIFSRKVPPTGLYKDQGIDIYESVKVPAGRHRLAVWVNDDIKIKEPIYRHTQEIELVEEQHMIIQFISDSGKFKVK